jgi:hypothetical protein
MRKIILLAALSLFSQYLFAQGNGQAATSKLLMGKWISNEDPVFTLQIFKDHLIHFNKGEDDSDYFNYELTSVPCDTTIDQRSKTGFYLNETSKEGLTTCSYIENLTADSLLLNYNWGARLLHFRKKK